MRLALDDVDDSAGRRSEVHPEVENFRSMIVEKLGPRALRNSVKKQSKYKANINIPGHFFQL